MQLIHVIATIALREGCRKRFLAVFKANVPNVLAEEGRLGYCPTVDIDSGIPVQVPRRESVVTIVEAWTDLAALHRHLAAPHMAAYREQVKELVSGVTLQVLEPA